MEVSDPETARKRVANDIQDARDTLAQKIGEAEAKAFREGKSVPVEDPEQERRLGNMKHLNTMAQTVADSLSRKEK